MVWQKLAELAASSKPCALCTVISAKGSTPRKMGAKMIVMKDGSSHGQILGTIGGGAIEHHIREQAIKAIDEQQSLLISTHLRNDLAMCCGGEMRVFIDVLPMPPALVCFGAGHITQALAPLAIALAFQVIIIDARTELLALDSFSSCTTLNHIDYVKITPQSYIIVATHDHALDQQIIEKMIKEPVAYLALVGSQRKALMTQKRLDAKGYSKAEQSRLICPAGLSIFAQTPTEIALSIAAQLIKVRNEPPSISTHSSSGIEHAHGLSQSTFT